MVKSSQTQLFHY